MPWLLKGWIKWFPNSAPSCIFIFFFNGFFLIISEQNNLPFSTLSAHDTATRFIIRTMQPPHLKAHLLEIVCALCFFYTVSSQHVLLLPHTATLDFSPLLKTCRGSSSFFAIVCIIPSAWNWAAHILSSPSSQPIKNVPLKKCTHCPRTCSNATFSHEAFPSDSSKINPWSLYDCQMLWYYAYYNIYYDS